MRAAHPGIGALIALTLAGCGGDKGGGRSDADVVRAWADAVRARHYGAAADLFALPSRIENGVTVEATHREDVDVFNRSLSCGAILKRTEPARGGRLLATFRLVQGAGGPGSACAGEAQVRFRIRKGHITEWIRTSSGPLPGANET